MEAVYRILNIGLAITNLPLESINMENDKVFFVVYNLFNDFRTELSLSAYYNIENMIFRMNQKNNTFTFLMSVSIISLLIGMLITFPAYKKVRYI